MPRFYCPAPLTTGQVVELPPGAARHVQVLRLQPGDAITLFNGGPGWDAPAGTGGEFAATVLQMGRSHVTVEVGAHLPLERAPARAVHLAVGMPANERMDWLVEKATELGVASLQPLMTERSVLRLQGERADKKLAHWQSVAIAASEQCGGNRVPRVLPVQTLSAWLATQPGQGMGRWVLSLQADSVPLAAAAQPEAGSAPDGTARATPPGETLFLCGPEGGLAPAEDQAARAAGFRGVTLGPRVLRSETAALAAVAALALWPSPLT